MRVLCRRTNKEYTKYCLAYSLFQSPSSVWRTTIRALQAPQRTKNFNPRPPCGGRLAQDARMYYTGEFQSTSSVWRTTQACGLSVCSLPISIHVLRVEDDALTSSSRFSSLPFQSTSSVWRTTRGHLLGLLPDRISIHVLRVEDDRLRTSAESGTRNFNPRPPCGGRRLGGALGFYGIQFQSTSSVWRTTAVRHRMGIPEAISIHVLRVEDDKVQMFQ